MLSVMLLMDLIIISLLKIYSFNVLKVTKPLVTYFLIL